MAGAVVAGALLQLLMSDRFTLVRPDWLLPGLELALMGVLLLVDPVPRHEGRQLGRRLALLVVALVGAVNGLSAVLLDADLVTGRAGSSAGPLLGSAAAIYATNVIAFAIWYWELDAGGPASRALAASQHPDFLFAQMGQPDVGSPDWEPRFWDYLYLSYTNATAFSPTDTLPLRRRAKLLMTLQSIVALSTTALVIARAVNVLR